MLRLQLIWSLAIQNTENSICRLTKTHPGMSPIVVHIAIIERVECALLVLKLLVSDCFADALALVFILDIVICVVKKDVRDTRRKISSGVFFAIINT